MKVRRCTSLGKISMVAIAAVLLAGCGPPTLDPSDYHKLETSVNKLRKPMEQDQRARFNEALTYLVGDAAVIPEVLQAWITSAGRTRCRQRIIRTGSTNWPSWYAATRD